MTSELPDDIRQRVLEDFGPQHVDRIYSHLLDRIPRGLANGTRPRHLRCILYLAKGDEQQLEKFIEMCRTDTRDVMLQAEYEGHDLTRMRDFNKPFDQAKIDGN